MKNSDFYKNLSKQEKKNATYTDFCTKLQNNMFLRTKIKKNKDKTLCLYEYATKIEIEEEIVEKVVVNKPIVNKKVEFIDDDSDADEDYRKYGDL